MHNNDEVLRQAYSYISQSMAGLEVENSKIDFKAIWYKLTEPKGISEFIKDTTAIANSFGPDGMIIIGYDDKKRELSNTSFADCGLKDSSQLPDLVNKRVDRLFQFNLIEGEILGFRLAVIHIPPSIDKPHVIRNYQTFDKDTGKVKNSEDHKIFIRRVSSTHPASKTDLDLMYYDRKNIQSDYELLSTLPLSSIELMLIPTTLPSYFITARINIIMENVGRRPVSISGISLQMSLFEDPSSHEIIEFYSLKEYESRPVILQSGELQNVMIDLNTQPTTTRSDIDGMFTELKKQKKQIKISSYKLRLSNKANLNTTITTY